MVAIFEEIYDECFIAAPTNVDRPASFEYAAKFVYVFSTCHMLNVIIQCTIACNYL